MSGMRIYLVAVQSHLCVCLFVFSSDGKLIIMLTSICADGFHNLFEALSMIFQAQMFTFVYPITL
jgi:hypothetical protein